MRKLICFLVSISSFVVSAQQLDLTHFDALKPRAIGPAGMSGRVTSIDVIESKPEHIFIGTASGGIWKSTNGGVAFEPIFDKAPLQSVGAIAINQRNPSVIWAGSGEGNPRNSQSSGGGIFKSIDGGRTWKSMGLENTKTIHRILINSFNPDVVYVAALGSAWGENPERGVYKTTDGGKTWKQILEKGPQTGCADLVMDPSNPNKLLAAMWQYGRKPYFFESGGDSSGLFLTYDGGENWKKLGEKQGLPKGKLGRMGLAISPSHPEVVYALVEAKKTGLYRSEDGGESWKLVTTNNIGNRPFYYADIYVDPQNPNKLWNLYSLVSKSIDGGKTFEVVMPYSGYHPDHHAFYIHPTNSNFIINGNDGGLNISRDGGKTWRFAENLPLAQFYHINYDMDIPYHVYGGMQDNGSWQGPAYVWKNGGIRNSYWQGLVFGDGFDVVPLPGNSQEGYAMYQGGSLYRYHIGNQSNKFIQPAARDSVPLRWNWNAGIAIDPFNTDGLYFGSQFLHYSNNKGESWEILSPDLTTNDKSKQQQAKSGGLTIDATKAENYTSITAIAPSPLNSNVIWVGTDDGNVQLTTNKGKTWKNTALNMSGLPENAWIAQINASQHDTNEVFVVVNNYRQNDWKPYLYHSTDLGKTWKNLATSDIPIYCLSVVQDPEVENLLFLGTEYGLYFSLDKGKNWTKWTVEYPSVSTMDLKIHPREGDLIIGTFGRACYILDDLEPIRELARTEAKLLNEKLQLFDIPTAYLADFKSPAGTMFPADGIFKGENRPAGARISSWIHPQVFEKNEDSTLTKEEKEIANQKKILVVVFNSEGDTVRHFETTPDTGMNRFTWNLTTNGLPWPGYKNRDEEKLPPSGMSVEPGKYLVRVSFRGFVDSALVSVKLPPNAEAIYGAKTYRGRILNHHKEVLEMVEQMNESRTYLKNLKPVAEFLSDSIQDTLNARISALKKAIKPMYAAFMLAEDFEGYDHVSVRISNLIGKAYEYYNGGQISSEQNLEYTLNELERRIEKQQEKLNAFYAGDWKNFVDFVGALNIPLIKDYEPIK